MLGGLLVVAFVIYILLISKVITMIISNRRNNLVALKPIEHMRQGDKIADNLLLETSMQILPGQWIIVAAEPGLHGKFAGAVVTESDEDGKPTKGTIKWYPSKPGDVMPPHLMEEPDDGAD